MIVCEEQKSVAEDRFCRAALPRLSLDLQAVALTPSFSLHSNSLFSSIDHQFVDNDTRNCPP